MLQVEEKIKNFSQNHGPKNKIKKTREQENAKKIRRLLVLADVSFDM